jgi:Ca2+-binding EF-hand superfamily protein
MYTLFVSLSLSMLIGSPSYYEPAVQGCPPTHLDERHKLKFGRYPRAAEKRADLQQQFSDRSLRLFNRLDRDKDGVISASEWQASRKTLAKLGCEGQPIDLEEYTIEKAYRAADINGDGQITRKEWVRSAGGLQEHHRER